MMLRISHPAILGIVLAILVALPSMAHAGSCALAMGADQIKRSTSRLDAITQKYVLLRERVEGIDNRVDDNIVLHNSAFQKGGDRERIAHDALGDAILFMADYHRAIVDSLTLLVDLDEAWKDRQAILGEIIDACAR